MPWLVSATFAEVVTLCASTMAAVDWALPPGNRRVLSRTGGGPAVWPRGCPKRSIRLLRSTARSARTAGHTRSRLHLRITDTTAPSRLRNRGRIRHMRADPRPGRGLRTSHLPARRPQRVNGAPSTLALRHLKRLTEDAAQLMPLPNQRPAPGASSNPHRHLRRSPVAGRRSPVAGRRQQRCTDHWFTVESTTRRNLSASSGSARRPSSSHEPSPKWSRNVANPRGRPASPSTRTSTTGYSVTIRKSSAVVGDSRRRGDTATQTRSRVSITKRFGLGKGEHQPRSSRPAVRFKSPSKTPLVGPPRGHGPLPTLVRQQPYGRVLLSGLPGPAATGAPIACRRVGHRVCGSASSKRPRRRTRPPRRTAASGAPA